MQTLPEDVIAASLIPDLLLGDWSTATRPLVGGCGWQPHFHTGIGQKRTSEPGAYCRACTYHLEEKKCNDYVYPQEHQRLARQPLGKKAYDRAFLEADLPEHFLHCPAVRMNHDFSKRKGMIIWPWRRSGTDFVVCANGVPAVPGADKLLERMWFRR
jgi:hypothetical protein